MAGDPALLNKSLNQLIFWARGGVLGQLYGRASRGYGISGGDSHPAFCPKANCQRRPGESLQNRVSAADIGRSVLEPSYSAFLMSLRYRMRTAASND